jgi:hypothetical protein
LRISQNSDICRVTCLGLPSVPVCSILYNSIISLSLSDIRTDTHTHIYLFSVYRYMHALVFSVFLLCRYLLQSNTILQYLTKVLHSFVK